MSNSSDFMDKKCDFAPVCTINVLVYPKGMEGKREN